MLKLKTNIFISCTLNINKLYMKKEIFHLNDFSFFLKRDRELSKEEKEQMHDSLVRLFPPFKVFYDKNKYYSTIKPQMTFLVKKGDELVGSGKLLWKTVKMGKSRLKFFGFGLLIEKPYQKNGIGTAMLRLAKEAAKKQKADLLYGSTDNPIAEIMLERDGFRRIKTTIIYKEALTKEMEKEKRIAYAFELKRGLVDKINKLDNFYIGIGPV